MRPHLAAVSAYLHTAERIAGARATPAAERIAMLDALDAPDPYCPVVRGGVRKLEVKMATSRELPKLESACTTIVRAR